MTRSGAIRTRSAHSLAIVVARKLRSDDVLHCLTDLFVAHGTPEHTPGKSLDLEFADRRVDVIAEGFDLVPLPKASRNWILPNGRPSASGHALAEQGNKLLRASWL